MFTTHFVLYRWEPSATEMWSSYVFHEPMSFASRLLQLQRDEYDRVFIILLIIFLKYIIRINVLSLNYHLSFVRFILLPVRACAPPLPTWCARRLCTKRPARGCISPPVCSGTAPLFSSCWIKSGVPNPSLVYLRTSITTTRPSNS